MCLLALENVAMLSTHGVTQKRSREVRGVVALASGFFAVLFSLAFRELARLILKKTIAYRGVE
jgi:hypothetical protein